MNSYTMILVFYNYIKCFHTNMEKNTLKISKSDSPSLSIDHGMFKSYSILSRCNSFSSYSNDSTDYCGSQSTQTRIKNGKRMPSDKQSTNLTKRSRNSSGSSVSSNISYISDKDLRSNRAISSTSHKATSKNNSVNANPSLKHSTESNNVELKDEATKNKSVPLARDSLIIPNTRTLRGKITRKGCACCPSTRTTVVVRRYHEIVKTTEKKTVISSTKVKTYVQKQSAQSTIQTNKESNKSSPSSSNARKKRRSEIEKLYESLHEIEWAKNFSPDNILRQINIRQAASCSVFGRSHTNTEDSEQKSSKKQKTVNDIANKVNSTINKSSKSENRASKRISNCEIKPYTNGRNCRSKIKISDVQTEKVSSNSCQYEPNFKSCNSQSSVNISCSVSRINVKEINIKSTESLHHTNSLVTVNGEDYCDDAQLSYTSDESSSAVSSSIVNIQSKHLLDLDYKDKSNRDLSDTNISEYSATPTFFDIAEEGIRTIDACFREVGAEVVVSTCYDESSLPSLTSVSESAAANKALDDGPPVLEPCVDVTSNQNINSICNGNSQSKNKKRKCVQNCSFKSAAQNDDKYDSASLKSDGDDAKTDVESEAHKKCYSFLIYRSNRDLLLLKAGKRISNKYFRWILRSRLKVASKIELKETASRNENIPKRSGRHCVNIKSSSETKDTKLLNHYQDSSLPAPVSLISHKIHPKSVEGQPNKVTISETTTEMCSKEKLRNGLMFDCTKHGSSLYNTVVKHSNEVKPSVIHKVQSSVTVQKSLISSFVAPKSASDNKIIKGPISRPLPSLGFSCHYNSIRVNRSNNYTQVIFKLTRGTSIFLTLEALMELKDALNRTSNDASCQILILNGIGDSFCLGLDLKPLVGPEKFTATKEMAVAIKELIEALSEFKKPLAAVVNGPALGLGMTLLNHADFTLASDKATFCMPHSYLGYIPEGGATLTLPQIVGSTVAMDLLIRGKTLTAREACNVGLISEVLEAKRLPQELVSRVRMMAKNSLQALETTKSLLKMQLHVNLQLVLENEVALLPRMWLTDTCQNALQKALHSGILSE